jgi:hypothetical protein
MLRRVIAAVAIAVGLSTAAMGDERGLDRVALVIGNSAYLHTTQIPNPANDARDIAAALGRLGFAVDLRLDLDKRGMDDAIRRFGDRRGTASAGLIYFAGHGLQVDGQNYLLPVDAKLEKERDLRYEAVSLTDMLFETERTSGINVIILDACRDNPLASSLARRMGRTRAALVGRGLARVEGAVGTLIAYATRDGTTAADGEGRNSPYTTGVLEWIEKPGLEISMMFRRVRESVMAATNEQQVPWEYGSLTGEFYFRAPGKVPADEPEVAAPSPAEAVDREVVFWETVKDSDRPRDFEEYLKQFPGGVFAGLAQSRIETLEEQRTTLVVPPKPEIEIDPIEAAYVAVKNANVREQPTVRSAKVATLQRGASVLVAGKVKGQNWYLVEQDGVALGFVRGDLLRDEAPDMTPATPTEPIPVPADAENLELVFWNSIANSEKAREYEAYLRRFPTGVFAALARSRIEQYGQSASAVPVSPRSGPLMGGIGRFDGAWKGTVYACFIRTPYSVASTVRNGRFQGSFVDGFADTVSINGRIDASGHFKAKAGLRSFDGQVEGDTLNGIYVLTGVPFIERCSGTFSFERQPTGSAVN